LFYWQFLAVQPIDMAALVADNESNWLKGQVLLENSAA
jgi:hypothetical protein